MAMPKSQSATASKQFSLKKEQSARAQSPGAYSFVFAKRASIIFAFRTRSCLECVGMG